MARTTNIDWKGRIRWARNDEVAAVVKRLREYLIIAGHPDDCTNQYKTLANVISRWPESIDELAKTDRLSSIPGVEGVITGYIEEIISTGSTAKFRDDLYGKPPPLSVLEITTIECVGAKTARTLYQDLGIDSLEALRKSMAEGKLSSARGIGPKTLKNIARSL